MSDGLSITPPLRRESGRCTCCPSCVLFPRSVDGKVLLPNPLKVKKVGHAIMRPPFEQRLRRCGDAVDREEQAPSPQPPSTSTVSESSQPPSPRPNITTYAQLSSLPGFKAFKLNQSYQERSEPPHRYTPETVVQAESGQAAGEFMKEIRVIKRTKKQNYVRSGTHDFCVRLYMGKNGDSN